MFFDIKEIIMKKITLLSFLTLLLIPLFTLSMEQDQEKSSQEPTEEYCDANWYHLPNEVKTIILSISVDDILDAIKNYSDDYNEESGKQKLVEIFRRWLRLNLIDKNIYQLLCSDNKFEFIRKLIKFWDSKVWAPKLPKAENFSFLHQAALHKIVWILKLGLDRKFDRGFALQLASRNYLMDFCKQLIEEGVSINRCKVEGLSKAICLHEYESIGTLATDFVKNVATNEKALADHAKMEVLGLAVECGNLNVIKLLLTIVGLEKSNVEQHSPLTRASKWGDLEVMELLINHGASVNEKTLEMTPLRLSMNIDIETAKFLLKKGALVNERYRNGYTLLIDASMVGNVQGARLLLENGAYINKKDKEGKTALAHASEKDKVDVVKLLLSKNAKYVTQALSIAKEKNNLSIISILEEYLREHGEPAVSEQSDDENCDKEEDGCIIS